MEPGLFRLSAELLGDLARTFGGLGEDDRQERQSVGKRGTAQRPETIALVRAVCNPSLCSEF